MVVKNDIYGSRAGMGMISGERPTVRPLHENMAFRLVLEKLHQGRGVDFSQYRTGTLERRMQSRLRATGCANYSAYSIYLNRNPQELDQLADALTINVTEFFRDPEMFNVLRTAVLPEIIRAKEVDGRSVIRVWSAGMSFGEEVYSLALLFLEALRAGRSGLQVRIYGTDIDPHCIEHAKRGVYEPARLKAVSPVYLRRYFDHVNGQYVVSDKLKRVTRFQRHNVRSDAPPGSMDLILCRNLLIYFTKPLQQAVYASFAQAVNQGGYLVLGGTESLSGHPAADFKTVDLRWRVYQKRHETVQAHG